MSLISGGQDDEVMAEINITPFTDVLLVLLIIFMILAALVTPPGFEKELPNSSNAPSTPQNDQKKNIEVVVTKNNQIFIDSKQTDLRSIYGDMADVARRRGNKTHVALTGDLKADYGIIIKILDAAKLSGLDDVGFVTSG
jgi:biopolymer transport protein ExbD